ncbi:MAG: RNA polymerase sigma factor [Blastocatellia bacterium]
MPNQDGCDLTVFLAHLDPDTDRAAEKYEHLRGAVTRYLQHRGSWSPEEQADETLEVLCRKITAGELIENPGSYARAIASNVLKRRWRKDSRFEPLGDDYDSPDALSEADEPEELKEARIECKRICLKRLPDHDRQMTIEYCSGRGHDRVRREELAGRYGMTPNQLRVTVCRIREKIRRCRDECLKEKSR